MGGGGTVTMGGGGTITLGRRRYHHVLRWYDQCSAGGGNYNVGPVELSLSRCRRHVTLGGGGTVTLGGGGNVTLGGGGNIT